MRLYTAFSCLQLQFTRQDLPACDDIKLSLIIFQPFSLVISYLIRHLSPILRQVFPSYISLDKKNYLYSYF